MKIQFLRVPAALILALCSLPVHAATPIVGQPAPALTFTDLLQAPPGTKADWPSLRGKVVVLEFWATWCAPCIAEIPHLNELSQSLASAKIQFISVDDEDPAVVKEFLAKKHLGTWVALDTNKTEGKNIFDTFGVKMRPTTVVVDTHGRIAAVLNPSLLKKEQLVALAAGKAAAFPKDEASAMREQALKEAKAAADADKTPGDNAPQPLFEISIRPGDPTRMTTMSLQGEDPGEPISYDIKNAPLWLLFQFALGTPHDRLVIHGTAPTAKYSMRLISPGQDTESIAPAIELAIAAAAGMKLSHVTSDEDTWVLEATPKAGSLLTPTASRNESLCAYNPHEAKMMMVKCTLGDLASQLEAALGVPVVNETALPGEFDANFDLPKGDPEATKAALEKNLGLTLVKAKRPISRIVLDPLPAPAQSTEKTAPAAPPSQMILTGPPTDAPMKMIAVPAPKP